MFDGNRFLPETGTPILKRALKRVTFAVCEPEPLTVAIVIEKLFMILFAAITTPRY
jgi:hypothetical protein